MKTKILTLLLFSIAYLCNAQTPGTVKRKANVDFDAYEKLIPEVKAHRKSKLIDLPTFLKMAEEKGTIILDTRSDSLFKRKHVKGAIHLNFSDFTQQNLVRIIPNADTRILIYCNNNFIDDQANFASKVVVPVLIKKKIAPISLALNIPTYINLYGYRNVYELSELVSTRDKRITFEGTEIRSAITKAR
ncbi:rhodanese-like domain-containing protein [Pedobacter sp. ISL-68]|uniref:rhodanese-like domain-containing protein n=1 Tax=unclassified Pedobacter TaxID=2628915 RepID=UPI001BE8B9E3|nr:MULTISPECIES: rhodanese-like domain-containing protein [unclassified Pedobacter]MBT2564607.1 rhodanese-like domain-containing protein [Pedobacter sp. ISL-64]MBT2588819.1 rhodanese-like domain-containing protein [Pedobacter sp. ISL-68]